MKLLMRLFIIIIFMFSVTNNYAQFNDPWGGSPNAATEQSELTPVDGNGNTPTQPTFGSRSSSPNTNTPPDMTTFFGTPLLPPGGPAGLPDTTVPIDGGITLLLAAGIGKGLKSYSSKKSKKLT